MRFQSPAVRFGAVAAAVAAVFFGGCQAARQSDGVAQVQSPAPVAAAAANAAAPAAPMPDFSSIVERYGLAVVNIRVEGTVKTDGEAVSPFGRLDPDDPFSEFLRRFGPQFRLPEGEQIRHGQGSGFIVSADGLILTNAHVVAEASQVTVRLTDKREFPARVVGIDKPTDIAVLRIDARDLPTIPLGDPAETRVGEWVMAIGSPFGFDNSVTAGIVSAKSRSLPDEGYVPFIQTDVAINPGNSGGPLLNLQGEVIGINSQIYSRSGGYQGLSFAIPIDVAARVKDQLLAHGRVTRGRLGVTIQDIDQALAESFGLKAARGALVSQVEKDSPAAKAGLEAGDVILKFGGEPIDNSAELPPKVAAVAPGKTVELQIWHDGRARTVEVTVGEQKTAQAAGQEAEAADTARLGVAVRPLGPEERAQAGTGEGLLVVDASGPAARAGIRAGDVILALNGRPVATADALRKALEGTGRHVALLIQRDDARIFVPIELG